MKNLVKLISTMGFLIILTALSVLYSDGWRFNPMNISNGNEDDKNTSGVVKKTGMLAVRSIPEGAKIYLDNEARTATDDTISSLTPKKYRLKITKEGFETWEKEVEVFSEQVTDITAVLVLQSPRLSPLTNNNVKAYNISTSQNNIAFVTSNHEEPGIWILPMSNSPFNIFTNTTRVLIPNNRYAAPSFGEKLWWSPDDSEILVQMNENGFLLYKIKDLSVSSNNITPEELTNKEETFTRWEEEWKTNFLMPNLKKIQDDNIEIPEQILNKIETEGVDTQWSPDSEKFFFLEEVPDKGIYQVVVFNSENPLPVGEQREYRNLEIKDTSNTHIFWYSDSYHLIIVTQDPSGNGYSNINLVRIDGSNNTNIYSGYLSDYTAYPSPAGDMIIVLTSLKESAPSNIYGIAIR